MRTTAIYPGSFDPVSNGHMDVIKRARRVFDTLILAVAQNSLKDYLFTAEERMEMLKASLESEGINDIEVAIFRGLTVESAREKGASVIIRGFRAVSDFEFECQLALTNRKLAPEIETIFMTPDAVNSFLSSSLIKEVAAFGGEVACFVPKPVVAMLKEKFILERG